MTVENIFLLLVFISTLIFVLAIGAAISDKLTRRSARRKWGI